jgi:hypothetical protein
MANVMPCVLNLKAVLPIDNGPMLFATEGIFA